jgi:signal transduction histidine kinase
MRRRIEFTRALVHELKTPLTAVIASSEALANELKDGPGPRLASNIYRGACNLDRRIDELLDLARSEVGALGLKCKAVDPLRLIYEVAEDMSPEAAKKGQSLVLEVPTSLPSVWADEERLRQVLLNLISNALKFNRKKGRVRLKAKEKDTSVIFEVQDEGEGIAEEDQQWLFQPYHRLESDREHLHGLGLGLALCKTLVELHHGQIWVTSQKGSGSTFGFLLPLRVAERQGSRAEL